MQVNPYLFYDGNCEAAFKFYERCLGGRIETILLHEGTPAAELALAVPCRGIGDCPSTRPLDQAATLRFDKTRVHLRLLLRGARR